MASGEQLWEGSQHLVPKWTVRADPGILRQEAERPVRIHPDQPAIGPVERDEAQFHAEWEKHVGALNRLVREKGVFNLDEFRHGIERMDPAHYLRAGYYERHLATLETNLVEKGVLTHEEIDRATEQL